MQSLSSHRGEPLRQVVLIETGLIFPQSDYSTQDLVIAREYRRFLRLLPIDPHARRDVTDATNVNRGDPRDWGILEHTDERGAFIRPLLFSIADVLQ